MSVQDLPESLQRGVAERDGSRVLLHASSPLAVLGPLVHWAESRGIDLPDLEVRHPSLEDVYLALTTPDAEKGR
jgi:hypothetical protein